MNLKNKMLVDIKEKESFIENKVCSYAKYKGFLVYKFSSPSNRGVPDRIFVGNGFVFFIEFKAAGKKTRKLQNKIINEIKDKNINVYIVDSVEYGINIINSYCEV